MSLRLSFTAAIPGYFNSEEFGMSSHIPHLETVLLVIASVYPTGFSANIIPLSTARRGFAGSDR